MKSVHPNHLAIRRIIAKIPRGRVTSYGDVAARAGLPRCARLVGRVLATSSEYKLPWHRVLRADGRLPFAPGSAEFVEQQQRLAEEGVLLSSGRVDFVRYGWQRNLDAELWAPRD
jgi:methylated-DNA-protein-cysteine methyltransferase-like protein